MLVRLLGKEEEAKAGTWEIPFTDVDNWAKPYVGYAYANGLTTGTGDNIFGSADTVTASQYLTFVLRALGYESGTDFQWNKAWEKSDKIGLTDGRYNAGTTEFTRGDVAVISNRALSTNIKNSNQTLAGFIGLTIDSPTITAERLQGIWMSPSYLNDEYNSQLGLYKTSSGFGASYIILSDNSFIKLSVSRVVSSSPLYNNREVQYNSGTYTIEGNTLSFTYDRYEGHDYNPDLSSTDLTPIQEVKKGLHYDTTDVWEVASLNDTELIYIPNWPKSEHTLVKCESAPLYDKYKSLVTTFESQLQQNAVNSLSTPVITSVYQSSDPLSSSRGLKVTWDIVPNAEGYELWYREGEFGKWFMWPAKKDYSWVTYTSKEVSHIWNYRSHGATYYFKVRAYAHDANGNKIYSEDSNLVYATQP